MAAGAVAGSSEPHDRLDPDVTGDVVVNVDVGRVDLTTKTMHVWDGSTLVLETQTTIGAPGTPTPLGTFFVNDHVAGSGSYGPHILSLSAYSESLETFNGGVPVVAIHGTNRPDLIDGAFERMRSLHQ